MARKIMIAVDGSPHQQKVLQEAVAQIRSDEDEMILFRAIELPEYLLNIPQHKQIMEKTCAYVQEEVEEVKTALLAENPQLKVSCIVEEGSGKHKITEFCKEHGMALDLVIMGVTGESDNDMAGSTTAYVVNHAPCNILVVK